MDSSLDASNVGDAPGNQLDELGEYGTEEETYTDSERDRAMEEGESLRDGDILNKKKRKRRKESVKRGVVDDSDNQGLCVPKI